MGTGGFHARLILGQAAKVIGLEIIISMKPILKLYAPELIML